MSGGLQCVVERVHPFAVVRLRGELDVATAAPARSTLLKCLADGPQALLVEISGMRVREPLALWTFTSVARQAAMWPAIQLLLCGPTAATEALLQATELGRRLQTFATVDAALSDGCPPGVLPSIHDELLPVSGAGRRARELITDACARWALLDLIGPACVIATELVANAVQHAGTMISLHLRRGPRYLHIAVRDGSPEPPVSTPEVSLRPEAQRGLLLVRAVSSQWGSLAAAGGKVVWAVLPIVPAAPSPAALNPAARRGRPG
jgi:anti-anti-sigma factor